MKLLFAFVLCLTLLSQAIFGDELLQDLWKNCGTSSDLLTINSVNINPAIPQKGHPISVSAIGTLSETVNNGTAAITVKYGFITLYKGTQSICQSSSKDPIECPIEAGQYNKNVTVTIPTAAPSGKYTGNLVLTSSTGAQIACIDVNFSL